MFDMTISQADLAEADELLNALLAEVALEETPLSGGTKQPFGTEALQRLRVTAVSLGDPLNQFKKLSPVDFERSRVPLTDLYRQQMANQFDFYYFTLTVLLEPGPGVQFSEVECRLDFGPAAARPIVQSMSPESLWNAVLQWGGNLSLQINADLSLGLSLPAQAREALPEATRRLAANADARAFVVVNDYRFTLGRAEIVATGQGSDFCFWRISQPELKQTQTATFGVIVKVLKGSPQLEINAVAAVYPSFDWLTQQFRYVLSELSDRFRQVFQRPGAQQRPSNRLPRGQSERWTIDLQRVD